MTDNDSWSGFADQQNVEQPRDLNLQLNKTLIMEFAGIGNRKDTVYCIAELDANMPWEDKHILTTLGGSIEIVPTLSAIMFYPQSPSYIQPAMLMSSFLIINELTYREIFIGLQEKFEQIVEFKRLHWFFNKVDVEAYISSLCFEFTSGKVDANSVEIFSFVIREQFMWGQQVNQMYQGAPMSQGTPQQQHHNSHRHQNPNDLNFPYQRD